MFKGHTSWIWKGLEQLSENTIVTLSSDKSLRVWDGTSGLCKKTIENIVENGGRCMKMIVP